MNTQQQRQRLIPNKLGYATNETEFKSIRSEILNINDNKDDDNEKTIIITINK
jgi:hypothetical protein